MSAMRRDRRAVGLVLLGCALLLAVAGFAYWMSTEATVPIAQLRLYNDTGAAIVVQRLDTESAPRRRVEPGETFVARDYRDRDDPVLGDFSPDPRRPSHVVIGVFAADGQLRGRLSVPVSYLAAHGHHRLCASAAAEPPLQVEDAVAQQTDCR